MPAADLGFLLTIESLRTPFLNIFFLVITRFGEETILLPLLCLLYWIFNKRLAITLSMSFMLAVVVNNLLKVFFMIPRPWLRDPQIIPVEGAAGSATGYSFPSGHTANAVSVYGAAAHYFSNNRLAKVFLWALILLIAFSRVYLGVHTPLDVIVSFLIGLVLLVALRQILAALDNHPGIDKAIFLIGLGVIAVGTAFVLLKTYPMDTDRTLLKNAMEAFGVTGGALIGWYWDRRKIHFREVGVSAPAILVGIVGIAMILAIRILLKSLLEAVFGVNIGAFFRYAMIGLWITGLYPFLLTLIMKKRQTNQHD